MRPRHSHTPVRWLVVGALGALSLAACGGGQTASSTPRVGAQPSATATVTPLPTPSVADTPSTTPSQTPSQTTSPDSPPAPPTNPTAAGLATCPGGGPSAGEPGAADNGPRGACFAAQILYPAGGATCHPAGGGTYAGTANCPLSRRLAQRLDQHPLSGPRGGGADALCRCQNTYQSAVYTVTGPIPDGPSSYRVRVRLIFGATSQQALDVIVQQAQSGSLVADIQCAGGGPATSILETPAASNRYLSC